MRRARESGDLLLAMTLMTVMTTVFLLKEEAQSGWPWIPEAFHLLLSCL